MSNSNQSNAEAVHQFTTETGTDCPNKPTLMNRSDVMFITRMVMSELDELVCTVCSNEEESEAMLQEALSSRDPCTHFEYANDMDRVGAQGDALVDAWYYSLNVAARHGINLSSIFDLVHSANMAKKDPVTGKFIRRESDGKIMKPVGWTSPDIEAEMERQTSNGSF